jgi:CRISPR/Cas system-associated exonuclease Cas4 (RecB family)
MRTIRASEIGVYLFCQRAWWYAKSGLPSENVAEMSAGSEIHAHHSRQTIAVGCLRAIGIALLLISLMILSAYLTRQLF